MEGLPELPSDAEEFFEAVLIKIRDEPESRKIPLISKMPARIMCNSGIDVGMAHQLLRFAQDLSYRQYRLLAMALDTKFYRLVDTNEAEIKSTLSAAQESLLSDCWDLRIRGLLGTRVGFHTEMLEINPGAIILLPLGELLTKTLALEEIPVAEVAEVADLFAYGQNGMPESDSPLSERPATKVPFTNVFRR